MNTQHYSDRWRAGRLLRIVALLLAGALVAASCGSDDPEDSSQSSETTEAPATTEAPDDSPDETEAPATTEAAMADGSDALFVSLQFAPVEEAEKFRAILDGGSIEVTIGEEGPTLDQILAGSGSIDVLGALHGAFPPLASENAMTNMSDVLEDLSADRAIAPAFVESGLLGTDDYLNYIPWAQATYIMAANTDALEYLPEGADVNAITWDELAVWCTNMLVGEGTEKCGLPKAGLFHRFLEGYMWPSFTGGMVSNFRSAEAVEMMTWARDTLWPTMNPESINYEFMQEPLLSGDVWVAFDHTARLIDAFNEDPDQYIAFPAPAGPAGRGFMPVIVGLGIPADAPNPDAGAAVIEFLTRPDTQGQILAELGFFPVVDGVDLSNLPVGVQIEADAVAAQANSADALPALLPIGLGDRGGEINQIFRNAFDRIVIDGEDIATVLDEEGDNLQALFNETGAPCWAPDPIGDGPCQILPAP